MTANATTENLPGALLTDDHQAGVVTVRTGSTEILRYHYLPDLAPQECNSPSLRVLRTLSGGQVTAFRPNDHRWHKGLVLMAMHLSGQNFLGGVSYVPGASGHGYRELPNVGSLDHTGFAELTEQGRPRFTETLQWRTVGGEHWIDERRTITVTELDRGAEFWTLEFATELHNVRGADLEFTSPNVLGRKDAGAGYCGLLWRGPRDFTGGPILAAGGLEGLEALGQASPWLAIGGEFDERDGHATLLFRADREGHGEAGPHWFVRSVPFPVVNPSLAFHTERALPAGETLRLRYRVTIADGGWRREQIEKYLADRPW